MCRLGHLAILLAAAAISRGGVKINVSRYMIKLGFLTLTTPLVEKWFLCAWYKNWLLELYGYVVRLWITGLEFLKERALNLDAGTLRL